MFIIIIIVIIAIMMVIIGIISMIIMSMNMFMFIMTFWSPDSKQVRFHLFYHQAQTTYFQIIKPH